jgi:hypothetical protein
MLKVEICDEEITISDREGIEIFHWVHTEWEEDPSVVPCIAHAIHLAYAEPEYLIGLNKGHIEAQREILRQENDE